MTLSVQPEWCLKLPLQQQSVLMCAMRGPDGIGKSHPCKDVVRAYRGTVLIAAVSGRELAWGEKGDSFMSLDMFGHASAWSACVRLFFETVDELPHHYLLHLVHGVQILGYKHPHTDFRSRWLEFYGRAVRDMHFSIETEAEMDTRLNDWDRHYW